MYKRRISIFVASKLFCFFERFLNLHITPVDYSSPIPNTCRLDEEIFEKVYDETGLDLNVREQMHYLDHIFPKYFTEYAPSANAGLTLVDSYILYAMIREKKPKVMIEVGSGESTKISLLALEKNEQEGTKCEFYAIEPYPKDFLRRISKENFNLIDKELQCVDIELLKTGDLIFIDSSHVSKIGSDVNYEILEVVPKLKKGSIIHWHDIMLPTNYWRDWIYHGNKFWNESYLLHAFMLFNEAYKCIWASRYMQFYHAEKILKRFPYFLPRKHRCTSFWLERVR